MEKLPFENDAKVMLDNTDDLKTRSSLKIQLPEYYYTQNNKKVKMIIIE